MSILSPHQNHIISSRHPIRQHRPRRLRPAAVKPPLKIHRQPATIATADDPSLRSTWGHRAWVATGSATVLIALAKSTAAAAISHLWMEPVLGGLAGYLIADLGSGVYHWGIDNYGDASSPVFGGQVEAFQGHHRQPWVIARRELANNLHALGQCVTLIVLPIDLVVGNPTVLAFAAACSGCIILSQQFHAWAHCRRRSLPALVVALQEAGLVVPPAQHAAHHRRPYNSNYCIVSGVWNELLDKHRVFEGLEMMLFFRLGMRPRSWQEPGSEWTQEPPEDGCLP